MNVSIIIVNYNTRELIKNCLKSIYEHTRNIDFEVIVSDNGSTDGSIEMIKSEFPQVVLINNNMNLGFGRANNIAAKVAKGKYLFFLNSDTRIINNAIYYFYKEAEENCEKKTNKILGCILLDDQGVKTHSYEKFTPLFKGIFRCIVQTYPILVKLSSVLINARNRSDKENEDVDRKEDIQFIIGADLFILTDIFFDIHGFDEKFFMYFEDEDLCRRAQKKSVLCDIIPNVQIIHSESKSTKIKSKKIEYFEHSFLLYAKKYYSFFAYVIVRVFFFFYGLFRFLDLRFSLMERLKLFLNVCHL